jgi:LysR family transcriptional regulator, carnitine catabolism transcriptional activator
MNVDLKQVRIFVMVARLGNFTRAAERLHLSQPSLSLHIRRLEQALRVRLFDRSTRAVHLTGAGQDFLPVAERLIEDFQSAVSSVADLAARRRGRVSVAVLPSIAAELLPRAIAALHRAHPDIGVSLRDDVAGLIAARVRNGEVDFGISACAGLEADLAAAPLLSDELLAVFPRRHPLAGAARPTWRALAAHPFIAMSRDSSVRQMTDQAFAHNGLVIEPVSEAKYMSTALGLVANAVGIAALPSSAVGMIRQAGLGAAMVHDPVMTRQIGILTRHGRTLGPAAQALVEALRGVLRGRASPERPRGSR